MRLKIILYFSEIKDRLQSLEKKISEQVEENSILLSKLHKVRLVNKEQKHEQGIAVPRESVLEQERESEQDNEQEPKPRGDDMEEEIPTKPVIPVLLFACNR